jgi:hypothetical protein
MTGDTDPITLKDAGSHFGFTVSTLKAEAGRGRLTTYKIGKRLYTTPADIREMVNQCRVEQKARGSISTPSVRSGSSETARISAAQDALNLMLQGRKKSSGDTSAQNTNRRRQATRS